MSKPLRVLQIEDSESDSELLLLLLMQAGYEVQCTRVEDAEELRHALKDPAWDVVIADYHLPSFDAPTALGILRENGREIPCIVVSGKMGEEVAVEMMKCGANDYLVKSNLPRLIPALERELRERCKRREGRQLREELRENQERLTLAMDAMQMGTFDFFPQTGVVIWSKFAKQHFGLSPEAEVSHDTFLGGVHPDDRERVAQAVQNALHGENSGDYAHEYRTLGLEDGKERWVSSRARVFFDSEARPVRLVGGMLDVTERKRREEQARESQKLESIRQLASGFAHDFNSLLTVINGYAQMVLAEIGAQHPLRDPMEELSKAAQQAAGLARQQVSLSRRPAVEPKALEANDLGRGSEKMLRNQSEGPASAPGDPAQGKIFKMPLPAGRTGTEAHPAVAGERNRRRVETILLAEDEPLVRRFTRGILERQGYAVLEASNGSEALALARRHRGPIHLLLTDITMPSMGGVELAEKLSSEYRGLAILFMSGCADQTLPRRGALEACLEKPFTSSALLAQTRALLDQAEANRERSGARELAAGESA
jgi:PAS domain S-box-containing protein